MKNKVRDILADKKMRLQGLAAQAETVVDLVTRTVSDSELVNQKTDDTVAEIDKYSTELACIRVELSKNRTHNTAIIANSTRLLEVLETESQPVAQ